MIDLNNNRIIELLKIKYQIIQGGMAGVSESNLVSAVSEAGGLGTLGSGLMSDIWLENEIRKTKEMTNNPFSVNLFMQNPNIEKIINVIIKNQVPIVFTGGGNPLSVISYFQAAGIIVIPVVPSSRLAKKMEDSGADAVVVEGLESGGHVGENTLFSLVPQTKKILSNIPLIAAGGIYDFITSSAAFGLGADGIQMGTRFLASRECKISESFKNKIINATEEDIEVVLRFTGHPLRVIKNKLSENWKKLEKKGAFPEEVPAEKIAGGRIISENTDNLPLLAGLSAAGIKNVKSCREIIEETIGQ